MNNGIPGKSIAVLLVLFLTVFFAAASTTVPAQLTFRKVRNSINCVPVLRNGNYLYTAGWKGFAVYDLKNPLEPELILRFPEISGRQMALSGGTLYITAREKGLWILDVSAPEKPVLLTRFDTVELATGIAVTGNIVFVAQRIYGVEILDCSVPEKPRHIGLIRGGEIQSVAFHNNLLYGGSWGHGRIHIWNVADLNQPKEVGRIHLDGFGDGMVISGSLCYAATGMHAKTGPVETRKNRGHGLEIFDVSNPRKPVRTGNIKFPPSPTVFFDSWTVTLSGETACVADTVNGIFLVDVSNPAAPKLTAWGKLPDCSGKPNPVGALAVGEGVLYVSGMDGLYTVVRHGMKPPRTPEKEPVPAESRKIPAELPGFRRYDVKGQVRRLFTDGDILYAACSHQGIMTFRLTEKELIPQRRFPLECSYDIAVRDGMLYSAEGPKGLAVYRVDFSGGLAELGRDPAPCFHLRTVSNPRFLICSAGGMMLFVKDVSRPENIRTVFKRRVRGIFYTDTAADRDINGIFPVNCHGGGVLWLDLNGDTPVLKHHRTEFLSGQNSAPGALKRQFLFPASGKNGCVLIDPRCPEQETGRVFPVKGFRNPAGTVSVEGDIAVFTDRHTGTITTVDFSDPEQAKVIPSRSFKGIPGSPGRAVFRNGRILIPAGHYGILYEIQTPATDMKGK